ncbi:hypothetical protein BC351_03165 [Paenibacillus ferrarius]|uniref:Uncharacterized protein n=1 Tax=Paenibacillus ferrarius TaxID=1469647 RepID=A0A1V4HJV9_9BACL|nr:hypothetical protein BC351_03165 [Paenibacillus ferrarius]
MKPYVDGMLVPGIRVLESKVLGFSNKSLQKCRYFLLKRTKIRIFLQLCRLFKVFDPKSQKRPQKDA